MMISMTSGMLNSPMECKPDEQSVSDRISRPDRKRLDDPAEVQAARREVWERVREKSSAYDETDVVTAFPPLHHFGKAPVWVGGFSRAIPTLKWRLIHADALCTEGDIQATPTQLTRAYLDVTFPDQLRAKKKQLDFWLPRRSQPMYTEPGKYNREMVYLDLKSAYWSIVKVIGWDVDYFPGMLVRRRGCDDFPFGANRLARNSLVSMGLPSKGFLYVDGRLISIPHAWKVNIGLWSAVQDILHGVADEMIKRAGAVYVNTDGYILPGENEAIAREIGAEWGLAMTEKNRGRATVYGVGAYSIGGKICSTHKRFAPSVQEVYPRYRDRLKRYFRMLADRYALP